MADEGAEVVRGALVAEPVVSKRPPWKVVFDAEVDDLFKRRLRVGTGVLLVLHVGAVFVFDEPPGNTLAAVLRIALFPFTIALFALTYWKAVGSGVRALAATFIVTVSAYAAWKNAAAGGDPLDTRSLTLTILTAGLLFPFQMRAILAQASAIIGFYIVGAKLSGSFGKVAFPGGVFFLVAATILAAVSARLTSRLRENEYKGRHELEIANQENETLLKNMLPEPIVLRLKKSGEAVADRHAEATVMFADLVGFTTMSATLSPERVVSFLNDLFSQIDALTTKYGLEKIKTIGDAYMVAGGLPSARPDHAEAVALLALDMRELVAKIVTPHGEPLAARIGIHSGPVVAGVIGKTKLTYDLWGDTVNTASRMESHGEPGAIQVSEPTYELLKAKFDLEPRGAIQVKGKGSMNVFMLRGKLAA